MIVYSVTVSVDKEIHEEWTRWMKEVHIPDVMATGIFTEYRMLKVLSTDSGNDGLSFNIQYTCDAMADLHRYQVQHAPALQKDHQEKYEGKVAAFRTLLEVVS